MNENGVGLRPQTEARSAPVTAPTSDRMAKDRIAINKVEDKLAILLPATKNNKKQIRFQKNGETSETSPRLAGLGASLSEEGMVHQLAG